MVLKCLSTSSKISASFFIFASRSLLNRYVYTLSKDDVSALIYPCAKPTDYAKFVGCDVWTNVEKDAQFIGNGASWLRTPNNIHKYRVAAINYDGLVYEYVDCYYEGVGVRPAIKLK